MKSKILINNASDITNYQALNCYGKDLGIVEGVMTFDNRKGVFVQLSTHYKDLFGNIKYAVPVDLCEIDHENKTIWFDVDKSELDFLYKLTDLYENQRSHWDEDMDTYFNPSKFDTFNSNDQNRCRY